MLNSHSANSPDAYLRPSFSTADKIRRLFWEFSWALLCRWTPKPLHSWRIFILRIFGASIGKQNSIYPTCRIWAPWLLQTHDVVAIGPGAEIYNPGGVRLEHHAIISQNAYLCGATHDYNSPDFTYVKKQIVLGPYAWVCARSIVLPGVHCGEGSVLGAGSVTSRDLEPWMVYGGNPAKAVKPRNNFLQNQKVNDGV